MRSELRTPFLVSHVGGVAFQRCTPEQAVQWLISDVIPNQTPVNVRLGNAYNVALAHKDDRYRRLLTHGGVNFPDGTPVVWFMRIRWRHPGPARRVRGPSLFLAALEAGVPQGTRHFFLGSTDDTLRRLSAEARRRFPGIHVAGTYSPPFAEITQEFIDDCAEKIRATDAQVIWVGLGTPKQDVVGSALAEAIHLPTINVGAAFDFLAGTVREAPEWVQRSGFEWLHRLSSEPQRLWRRYLFGNARFLRAAVGGLARSSDASRTQVRAGEFGLPRERGE